MMCFMSRKADPKKADRVTFTTRLSKESIKAIKKLAIDNDTTIADLLDEWVKIITRQHKERSTPKKPKNNL